MNLCKIENSLAKTTSGVQMPGNEYKLAPSILSADFSCLKEQIKEAEEAGADLLHIDVMDGHFVPNITVGPVVVEKVKSHTNLPFDVHLMIERPDIYADMFIDAGADYLSFHMEAAQADTAGLIERIKGRGVKAGLVINPETGVDSVKPYLETLDFVLVMSVNPGFAGQKFMDEVLPKITEIKEIAMAMNLGIEIEIDGGITADNISKAKTAGADIFVAGSSVFSGESIKKNIETLKGIL